MSSGFAIERMSAADKIAEAIDRSSPYVSSDLREAIKSFLKPQNLATIAGTLVFWAGSHAFGVGEIVDIILLGAGAISFGFSIFEGSSELLNFAVEATNTNCIPDIDSAAKHFARATTLLGLSSLQVVLLRGPFEVVTGRGRPQIHPRPFVGHPPVSGNQLILSRPERLTGGSLGTTTAYGEISVARNQSLSEQRLTLFHELVHRYLSPRTGPLRKLRAEVSMSAYSRFALLRYLEEALAEGYGQLRMHGFTKALVAFRFPIQGGYVTVSQVGAECLAIGTITLGGMTFYGAITLGQMPSHD